MVEDLADDESCAAIGARLGALVATVALAQRDTLVLAEAALEFAPLEQPSGYALPRLGGIGALLHLYDVEQRLRLPTLSGPSHAPDADELALDNAQAVRRFHLEMLERAAASIDAVEPERRDISAMTVCVRADSVAELKQKLRDFREQFIGLCDSQDAPDQVYQVNIQFFPLSKPTDPDPEP